jgi:VIT1/CCC1 family predicted Fe2+/Mn2+ transporter
VKLARPVIFGLADGSMSILGVVAFLTGHAGLVFPAALAGGLTASVSMATGEWLSDSGSGPGASVAMGAATLTGSVLPAIPYAFTHGWLAPCLSATALAAVALTVARLRSHRKHPYLETFAALGLVVAVSVACAVLAPGS